MATELLGNRRRRRRMLIPTLVMSLVAVLGVTFTQVRWQAAWPSAAPGPARVEPDSPVGAVGTSPDAGPDAPHDQAGIVARQTAASAPLPVGDLPGWRQIFSDDFTTPVAAGSWDRSAYARRWLAYDGFSDTRKVGRYSTGTLSVSGGDLTMTWNAVDGVPLVSGVVPLVGGKWGGQRYGRYSVRFRATSTPGYAAAMLLWPDSNDWSQGEIDFAEGALNQGVNSYHHCLGVQAATNCALVRTNASWTDWHVATVEWTPSQVTYDLDGQRVLASTVVPAAPMHLVLQGLALPGAATAPPATVQVDWVSIWGKD